MESILNPPHPLELTGNVCDNFRKFKQRYENYMLATGANTKSNGMQVAILLHVIGEEALEVYNTLTIQRRTTVVDDVETELDINTEDILKAMENYCNPRKNTVFERYKFYNMKQVPGVKIDEYITSLKVQAKLCEFKDQLDDMIRDRIVCGIADITMTERLLREPCDKLTLNRAIELCRASESSKEQIKEFKSERVDAITTPDAMDYKRNPKKRFDVKKTQNTYDCRNCGIKHAYRDCPAYRHKCRLCNKQHHFETLCKSNTKVRELKADDEQSNFLVGKMSTDTHFHDNYNHKPWYVVLYVNNIYNCSFKLDTGAETNVIDIFTLKKIDPTISIQKSAITLTAFGGSKITTLGFIYLKLLGHKIKFFVVKHETESILGLNACINLGLIKRTCPENMIDIINTNDLQEKDNCCIYNPSKKTGESNVGRCSIKAYPGENINFGHQNNSLIFSRNNGDGDLSTVIDKSVSVSTLGASQEHVHKWAPPEKYKTQSDCETSNKNCLKTKTLHENDIIFENKDLLASSTDALSKGRSTAGPLAGSTNALDKGGLAAGPEGHERSTTDILGSYKDVFTGLGKMPGKLHIFTDKSVPPVIHAPRNVPYSLKNKLKSELDNLVNLNVIEKVEHPTDWVNSIVLVETPKFRLCLDPSNLNKAIKRPHHLIPTGRQVADRLAKSNTFTVFDMTKAYHQIELDNESADLTCFNSPFGRYRYLRMPFGISCASDVFQIKGEQIFGHIEGVEIIADEILIHSCEDKSSNKHDKIIIEVLECARKNNVKLNWDKIQFKKSSVKYMGDLFTSQGLKPDPEKVQAIKELKSPSNKTELRRILGMINFVGHFIPNLSKLSYPIRNLLKKDSAWVWDNVQEKALNAIKESICDQTNMAYFDPEKESTLQVDASKQGLGVCLLQSDKPVAYRSRSLNEAEINYSNIERELLAVVWALECLNQYTYGCRIIIHSDHKPLMSICKKPMHMISPRLQRLMLRAYKYNFTLIYKPGKELIIADTLSRAASINSEPVDPSINFAINSLVHNLPVSEPRLTEIREYTASDNDLTSLKEYIMHGFPDHKSQFPVELRQYWHIRDQLHVANDLIMFGGRIVIPCELRGDILNKMHESHLGITKTRSRAAELIYWPGLMRDIETHIRPCTICNSLKNDNCKEKLVSHTIPDIPWNKLGIDILTFGNKDYLLIVDYFSKYPEIVLLKNKGSPQIIIALKSVFARHGVPSEIVADNVPFNSQECRDFAKEWNFCFNFSSPTYSQSNGQAERFVQTIKRILLKAFEENKDPYVGLMEYRATPFTGLNFSPAQLLFSRKIRTKLPICNENLYPKICDNAHNQLLTKQVKSKKYYDKNAKNLPVLKEGDTVRFKHNKQWVPGIVKTKLDYPRSYLVQSENEREYRRNRKHLQKSNEMFLPQSKDDDIANIGNPTFISENLSNNENFVTQQNALESNKSDIDSSIESDRNDINNSIESDRSDNGVQNDSNIRTSARIKALPNRFKDYVMSIISK